MQSLLWLGGRREGLGGGEGGEGCWPTGREGDAQVGQLPGGHVGEGPTPAAISGDIPGLVRGGRLDAEEDREERELLLTFSGRLLA